MFFDSFKKRQDDLDKIRHVCSCGHTVYVPKKFEFSYCNYCWKRVYRDKQTEFKHKLLIKMGKRENNQRS